MSSLRWIAPALVAVAPLLGPAAPAHAQVGRIEGIAQILSEGRPQRIQDATDRVQIQQAGSAAWVNVAPGAMLSGNERLQVQRYVDARMVVATRARPEMTFLTSVLRPYVGRAFAEAGREPEQGVYRVSAEADESGDLRVDIDRGALVVRWKRPGRLRVGFADKTVLVQGTELVVEVDADGRIGHIFVLSGLVSLPGHPDFVLQPNQLVRLEHGMPPQVVSTAAAETQLARRAVRYHGTQVWGTRAPTSSFLAAAAVAVGAAAAVAIATRGSDSEAALREGSVRAVMDRTSSQVLARRATGATADSYRVVLRTWPSQGEPSVVEQPIDPARPTSFSVRVPEGTTRFRIEVVDRRTNQVLLRGERTLEVQQSQFVLDIPLLAEPVS